MNHANSYFWTGKTFAAQYFTAVPFGLNFQGINGWLYDGGGQALWDEVYAPFGMKAFACGNTGVQMTGWFKKEVKSVADFKGLKMRIPGLAGRVYAALGVDVKLLPGGEIFPALERGVIDAAEFVGPFLDRRLGLQKAAKFYYTTGWHESATVSELLINKAAWDKLPKDLQAIVENASAACNVISEGWCQRNNADAMDDLIKNQGVIARPLPADVLKRLREVTGEVLAESAAKDPMTKKVHDSYMAYKRKYDAWCTYSEGPYHEKILTA
jgi:TRAP-type mannitol/chloroaromatic compound transport system substrate-binding protein